MFVPNVLVNEIMEFKNGDRKYWKKEFDKVINYLVIINETIEESSYKWEDEFKPSKIADTDDYFENKKTDIFNYYDGVIEQLKMFSRNLDDRFQDRSILIKQLNRRRRRRNKERRRNRRKEERRRNKERKYWKKEFDNVLNNMIFTMIIVQGSYRDEIRLFDPEETSWCCGYMHDRKINIFRKYDHVVRQLAVWVEIEIYRKNKYPDVLQNFKKIT